MSDFSLTLVLQIKTSKIINDMANLDKNLGFKSQSDKEFHFSIEERYK